MLIDVDIPTSLATTLSREATHREGVSMDLTTGYTFGKEFPFALPWLVKNGYRDMEMLVMIGPEGTAE